MNKFSNIIISEIYYSSILYNYTLFIIIPNKYSNMVFIRGINPKHKTEDCLSNTSIVFGEYTGFFSGIEGYSDKVLIDSFNLLKKI